MSELRDTLTDVLADRESGFGEDVVNLRTNATFSAEIETISDIELIVELGNDAREACTIHVRNAAAASAINRGDQLAALGAKFRVVKRTNNPADLQAKFVCIKIVPGKDT